VVFIRTEASKASKFSYIPADWFHCRDVTRRSY